MRRIFSLLKPRGLTGFITTNSIKDGDIREDGLEQIIRDGGEICMAVRAIKWPGHANLVVSLLSIHKGPFSARRTLDGREVVWINAFLEDSREATNATALRENAKQLFQGSIYLGDGFLLSNEEAERLISVDPRNSEVVFATPRGKEDINNAPDQAPGRSIINFRDWSMEQAALYPAPFGIIERLVKPYRQNSKRKVRRERWWQYAEQAKSLYSSICGLPRCFVTSATTKFLNFSATPTSYVFTHALFVFATDRWDLYTVVQSTVHEVWARKYSGSLETRLRYSPSDCFETFPFPEGLWQTENRALAETGEQYHGYRKSLMLSLWLGLTDIYNLFHARDLTPAKVSKVSKKPEDEAQRGYEGILELRRLHRELDLAVRDAYGWDFDLEHDFHEVETLPENDRVRYTISPTARKEVLKRLLALNHERAAAETAAIVQGKQRKRFGPAAVELPELSRQADGAWKRTATTGEADLLAVLAAILKASKGPERTRQIRLAALLVHEPRLLTPSLTLEEATQWRRLVGEDETKPLALNVSTFVPQAQRAWGRALGYLRGHGMLIEDLVADTWSPGPGIEAIETTGWPDGRAQMVLHVLRRRGSDDLVHTLPTTAQSWIDEQAA